MSTRLAIVGSPAALELAGVDGSFDWGAARCAAPDDQDARSDADVVVALDGPGQDGVDVRWLAEPASERLGGRVVAPDGDGLWGRALWPARDELFELAEPEADARVLVVAGDEARGAAVAERLAERGVPTQAARELTAGALSAAAAVAFLPDESGERPMPGAVTAVLAAGRRLIAPRCRVTFGLLPGTDHLAAGTEDDVVQYADALFRFPAAFEPLAVFGRLAARPHRASTVYGRLVDDVLAERAT